MNSRSLVLPLFYFFYSTMSLIMVWSLVPELLEKQLVALLLGFGSILVISRLPLKIIFQNPKLWYLILNFGLVLTLVIPTDKSTQRWIDLPFFSIQPSQFAFLLVSLSLIAWIEKYGISTWSAVVRYSSVILLPALLIVIEPNLGTTLLFLSVMTCLLFLAGLPIRYVFIAITLGTVVAWSGWNWWLKDYQKTRLTSFIYSSHNSASTYNSQQALIAIGSGGVWGQGLGEGSQSQLKFLPEKHTDFIFASIAEEFGLIGSLLVLGSYGVLISFLIWQSHSVSFRFRLFLLTAASLFFFQITLHIGANLRLLPITGVPLPIISYGGSSILSFALIVGVCQRIIREITSGKRLYVS